MPGCSNAQGNKVKIEKHPINIFSTKILINTNCSSFIISCAKIK